MSVELSNGWIFDAKVEVQLRRLIIFLQVLFVTLFLIHTLFHFERPKYTRTLFKAKNPQTPPYRPKAPFKFQQKAKLWTTEQIKIPPTINDRILPASRTIWLCAKTSRRTWEDSIDRRQNFICRHTPRLACVPQLFAHPHVINWPSVLPHRNVSFNFFGNNPRFYRSITNFKIPPGPPSLNSHSMMLFKQIWWSFRLTRAV